MLKINYISPVRDLFRMHAMFGKCDLKMNMHWEISSSEQCQSCEDNITQPVKTMEPEGSLPYSQVLTSGPVHKNPSYFFKIPVNIIKLPSRH
jgi:hypothetical protein